LIDRRLLADGAGTLRAGIDAATDAAVIAITGSSSVGAADHLRTVLTGLGARWHVDGVACRPGHPQALASLPDGRWVVGLPGNPFAGLVAALTILEPLIAALSGRPLRQRPTMSVIGDAQPFPGGVRLVPVRIEPTRARIVPGARSGSLRAAATADALAVLQPDWVSPSPCELLTLP
jgi:molybdopterin molybdotransferase